MTSELDATKNVAVLLTPAGSGAIAVVRLRGEGTGKFLAKYFSRAVMAGRCVHGTFRDGGEEIDDGLVVVGERGTWADLNLHGGRWIVEEILGLARREGFEIFHNAADLETGRLVDAAAGEEGDEILQREMLASLPVARTERAIEELLAQPGLWKAAREKGMDATAMLADESLWWMLNLPQVAIVGEPNVGKSTLANRLFGQERSITADVAGTTRDWVGEMANIDGLAVELVDTPGVRQSADALERAAIGNSLGKVARSDLVICVLDATREPSAEGRKLMKGAMVVVNKIDCPAGWDFAGLGAVEISARTGDGVEKLRRKILARFGIGEGIEMRARWWTLKQREELGKEIAGQNPR